MEFCPECGSILLPKNNKTKCKCGYENKLTNDEVNKQYKFKGEINPQNKVIVTDKNSIVLPTCKITCYKCKGTKGYWWTLQTRSADEASTYFIRCAKCGNTWRQSN